MLCNLYNKNYHYQRWCFIHSHFFSFTKSSKLNEHIQNNSSKTIRISKIKEFSTDIFRYYGSDKDIKHVSPVCYHIQSFRKLY